MLFYFLHHRMEVVTRRLEHELAALRKRLHILEGFEKIFDALDDILKIVLKIYRLARLEILVIKKELEDKRRRVRPAARPRGVIKLMPWRGGAARDLRRSLARSTRCSRTSRRAGTSSASSSRKSRSSTATHHGYALRFSLKPFIEPSTRSGRRFARTAEKAAVVGVARVTGDEILIAATRQARAMLTKAEEVNFLSGPGRGVILIKPTCPEDRVLGFVASTGDRDLLTVETSRGAEQTISTMKYEVTGRGGKGRELLQRGQFTRVVYPIPDAPQAFGE